MDVCGVEGGDFTLRVYVIPSLFTSAYNHQAV